MKSRTERDELIAKAKWADEMAARFEDGFYKVSWLFIADGYRDILGELDRAEAALRLGREPK